MGTRIQVLEAAMSIFVVDQTEAAWMSYRTVRSSSVKRKCETEQQVGRQFIVAKVRATLKTCSSISQQTTLAAADSVGLAVFVKVGKAKVSIGKPVARMQLDKVFDLITVFKKFAQIIKVKVL